MVELRQLKVKRYLTFFDKSTNKKYQDQWRKELDKVSIASKALRPDYARQQPKSIKRQAAAANDSWGSEDANAGDDDQSEDSYKTDDRIDIHAPDLLGTGISKLTRQSIDEAGDLMDA